MSDAACSSPEQGHSSLCFPLSPLSERPTFEPPRKRRSTVPNLLTSAKLKNLGSRGRQCWNNCAGDMAPVRELLASSSAELQSQMLGSILKSDRKALNKLAADVDCLRALDLWMIDLIPDTRAFQILEDIIQVRSKGSAAL